ncbi:MAG: iron-sulfur cluster assembly scaffold protein [Dehalococcoidales bacterium]|nr:iron-sulfur cluster assembly scaffold protein [Dehalococcoidales bacterium]
MTDIKRNERAFTLPLVSFKRIAMDEAVVRYYRKLVRDGYKYAGPLENPSIILKDEPGEKIRVCSSVSSYIKLFIKIDENRITEIKYLCTCNPVTHVAIEILCKLIDGKTLEEAVSLNTEPFLQELGSASDEMSAKANGFIELLRTGTERYLRQTAE